MDMFEIHWFVCSTTLVAARHAGCFDSEPTCQHQKGINAMAMRTSPVMGAPSDQDIQKDVLEELRWDARVTPNEIGVIVQNGVVTLTGWVDSYTKKWAAEDAAMRVRGVKAIANEIEVRLASASERTDSDIAAAALGFRSRPLSRLAGAFFPGA
jgi:hypothetical protein